MDFITFCLACRKVLLKAPRLILAFVSLKLAFSSNVNDLPEILSDNMSIKSVSSWVTVKVLFLEMILTIGSLMEPVSHVWTLSFSFNSASPEVMPVGYSFVYALDF